MNKSKIWLSSPHMGEAEINYVEEAFATNWIAPLGPHVDGFESDLEKYIKIPHAAVLSSGTAAIHLALVILGVGVGDEVICQSFTFSGSANPIAYVGALPVFVDSEMDTWNMCPTSLETAIKNRMRLGKKPKAIIPVHLYGMPANMIEILAVASKYQIPVIEDAAEALGSQINSKMCGSFGDIGILSFNGNKIITTSGGGAMVSSNKIYIDNARFLSTQARDNAPHYQHSQIGYNYRMSNILAGVGRGQMKVLEQRVAQRRANNLRYREFFKDIQGVYFQNEPNKSYLSNYWLTAILIDPNKTGGISREDVRLALELANIESRPLWKPMHMQPVYQGFSFFGTGVCEHLFEQGLCLPSGSNLGESDFDRIFEALRVIFQK